MNTPACHEIMSRKRTWLGNEDEMNSKLEPGSGEDANGTDVNLEGGTHTSSKIVQVSVIVTSTLFWYVGFKHVHFKRYKKKQRDTLFKYF